MTRTDRIFWFLFSHIFRLFLFLLIQLWQSIAFWYIPVVFVFRTILWLIRLRHGPLAYYFRDKIWQKNRFDLRFPRSRRKDSEFMSWKNPPSRYQSTKILLSIVDCLADPHHIIQFVSHLLKSMNFLTVIVEYFWKL